MSRRGRRSNWNGWDRKPPADGEVKITPPTRDAASMTDAQARYLRSLCAQKGEKFNESWTKVQASRRINQLRNA